MKRIAFISTNAFVPWAGSEELWSQTALRLASAGHFIGVNVPQFENEASQIGRLERALNIKLHRRMRRWPLWRRIASRAMPLGNPDIAGWLADVRPELAVISQGGSVDGHAWMEACRRQGVPYILIVHLSTDSLWPDPMLVELVRPFYEAASAVFFVSENNRQVTAKHLGINLDQAKIVRNPFLVDYDNQVPWPDAKDGYRLACIGRLGAEHKGQDLLFEVMREPKWKKRSLTVTLFGQGHHRETLERLQAMWDVPQIRFGGQSSNIEGVWADHHALIMPSRYEGLPLALVEAMLCHRVAIGTDVGGNVEFVEDAKTGFVASAPTVPAIDRALERAWDCRDKWQQMGIAAGERVRQLVPRDPVAAFIGELTAFLK